MATLYVDPTGSDSNPGTAVAPFKTVQKAANVVNPGDTVIVRPGTYPSASNTGPILSLPRGGTSTSWVTFRAEGAVVLDGRRLNTAGVRFGSAANYMHFTGFEICHIQNHGSCSGIELYSGGHDVIIEGCHIHDVGRHCTDTVNGQSAIFVQQPRVVITRNVIYAIGRYGPGEGGCQPTTGNYKNHDHGIYANGSADGASIPGASDLTITNNIIHDCQHGWPVQLYPGSLNRVRIFHNTFASGNTYITGHVILGANLSDVEISNNIFDNPNLAAINKYSGTYTNLVLRNNLVSGGKPLFNTVPPGAVIAGTLAALPRLDAEFRLLAGSPAIDAGIPDLVTVDIDGTTRGVTPDIGADEYGGPVEPPVDPPVEPPPADTTAPTVTITAPAEGATVTRSVTITATVADTVAVATVEFFVDNNKLATDADAPYAATWNCRRAAKGPHTLTVIATDTSGNKATATVTVVKT